MPRPVDPETIMGFIKALERGETVREIADQYGTRPTNIGNLIRKYTGKSPEEFYPNKVCALPECGVEFRGSIWRKYCCKTHSRRASSRATKKYSLVQVPCLLPECDALVWTTKKDGLAQRKACCRNHGELHSRRIRTGVYTRIQGKGPSCEVCGNHLVDEHHEEWNPITRKSNKSSRIHYLCPTHHMMIHRSMAEYREGQYVELETEILDKFEEKNKIFSGYLSPGISGRHSY